jgi:hypothetical protein
MYCCLTSLQHCLSWPRASTHFHNVLLQWLLPIHRWVVALGLVLLDVPGLFSADPTFFVSAAVGTAIRGLFAFCVWVRCEWVVLSWMYAFMSKTTAPLAVLAWTCLSGFYADMQATFLSAREIAAAGTGLTSLIAMLCWMIKSHAPSAENVTVYPIIWRAALLSVLGTLLVLCAQSTSRN